MNRRERERQREEERYINQNMTVRRFSPTADQQRRWQDHDLCIWCGNRSNGETCYCRYCGDCTSMYMAGTLAEYSDTENGPKPHVEICAECAFDEAQARKKAAA
jgi:hypothetical protein